MRIYLDDDIAKTLLARLPRKAGHDVEVPNDVGMTGAYDPEHLAYAIKSDRVFLSQNHDDFKRLHLLLQVGRAITPVSSSSERTTTRNGTCLPRAPSALSAT